MFKIALVSGAPPQTPLGELTTLPQTPSREGLLGLAFGNRSFAPSALALSPIFSIGLSVSLNFSDICPQKLCTDLRLYAWAPLLIFL